VGITEFVVSLGTHVIGTTGYAGVFLLMVAESMVLPVPSEAVMPFAGFLVAEGTLSSIAVVALATLGSLAGSLLSYAVGRFGGRPFVGRFGRYLLLDAHDLNVTDRFFQRHGTLTVFVSRFIPVVRHLISIPAGLGRMRLLPFSLLTIAGAGLWNAFLTWCGFSLRRNWTTVTQYTGLIDIGIVAVLALLVILFLMRHLRRRAGRD